MAEETILEEIHRVRRELSAEHDNDVHAFFEYLRRREGAGPGQVVTLERVPPESAGAASRATQE